MHNTFTQVCSMCTPPRSHQAYALAALLLGVWLGQRRGSCHSRNDCVTVICRPAGLHSQVQVCSTSCLPVSQHSSPPVKPSPLAPSCRTSTRTG